ncbi:MAG: hypothetical protein J7L79_05690 [Thaumarchaeota archaeon]|nr:hypothetical protein [Nitrososphaerota archaeon]
MAERFADEELVDSLISLLKGMWFIFAQMASLLRRFSGTMEGPLKVHASLASNRISILAKNLEDGLTYLGASFLEVPSLEELRKRCGVIVVDVLSQLAESLSSLERRVKAQDRLDVGSELEKFEKIVKLAVNAFSRIQKTVSELEDERAKLLNILLEDLVSDLSIIGERMRQARLMMAQD